jgi:hypothetical protein
MSKPIRGNEQVSHVNERAYDGLGMGSDSVQFIIYFTRFLTFQLLVFIERFGFHSKPSLLNLSMEYIFSLKGIYPYIFRSLYKILCPNHIGA